jgi:hypothetical protein
MAKNVGMSVAYCTIGGIVLFAGIKGATLTDTVKGVLTGNIAGIQDTQSIALNNGSSSGGTSSPVGASA